MSRAPIFVLVGVSILVLASVPILVLAGVPILVLAGVPAGHPPKEAQHAAL